MTYKSYGTDGAVQHTESGAISFPESESFRHYEEWLAAGNTLTVDPVEEGLLSSRALLRIDADVDAIYSAAVGNRAREYEIRETEARAFKAAGYTGTVGPFLQDFVDSSPYSAQQAADTVIAQADGYEAAVKSLSTNRLAAKAAVRAGVPTAMSDWQVYVAQLRTSLGLN